MVLLGFVGPIGAFAVVVRDRHLFKCHAEMGAAQEPLDHRGVNNREQNAFEHSNAKPTVEFPPQNSSPGAGDSPPHQSVLQKREPKTALWSNELRLGSRFRENVGHRRQSGC
jgi:hypothetical protein